MRSLIALSAIAMLIIPETGLAQSAASMGADPMGTGHLTVGTGDNRKSREAEGKGYDLESDDVRTKDQQKVEGPDVRFH